MAEGRHSPLDGLLPWSLPAKADAPLVSLAELRFARQIGLRLRPPMPAYIGGVPLPSGVGAMRRIGPTHQTSFSITGQRSHRTPQ